MASKPVSQTGKPSSSYASVNKTSAPKPITGKDYASEGVKDNDITKLGSSDWELLGVLTLVGTFVRLFRIYQPTSVVFDEVQYESFLS